jgi:excisionase family DNA binding protein
MGAEGRKVDFMEPTPYLTVRQAADVLGVHHKTLRKWIANGTVRAVRFSPRTTRIAAADLVGLGIKTPTTTAQGYDEPLPLTFELDSLRADHEEN